jgi:hypothetical protein
MKTILHDKQLFRFARSVDMTIRVVDIEQRSTFAHTASKATSWFFVYPRASHAWTHDACPHIVTAPGIETPTGEAGDLTGTVGGKRRGAGLCSDYLVE